MPDYLSKHIASFVRIGFVETGPQENPYKIISSYYSTNPNSHPLRRAGALRPIPGSDVHHCPLLDSLIGPYWMSVGNQLPMLHYQFNAFTDTLYPTITDQAERLYPPGLRDHLTSMRCSDLRALARTIPGARCSGTKAEIIQNLLHFITFTTIWR